MSKKKSLAKNTTTTTACAILPYLYLGPRASASASSLTQHNITDVLSIGSQPPERVEGVQYHRVTLSDEVSASIRGVSDEVDSIVKAVSANPGKVILLHCSAAVSRSPTLVVAHLMKYCGMSLYDALALVIQARPAVCPNPGFLSQLRELELEIYFRTTLVLDELPRKRQDRLKFFGGSM
ncbi:hypothetical protein ABW20_dc0110650 [Dactylellina cionopaga]|nr:hypothetical protein ABW20_dc0110650 [Dactylellina cionopaga]